MTASQVTFLPDKTQVEFRDWPGIDAAVKEFLRRFFAYERGQAADIAKNDEQDDEAREDISKVTAEAKLEEASAEPLVQPPAKRTIQHAVEDSQAPADIGSPRPVSELFKVRGP